MQQLSPFSLEVVEPTKPLNQQIYDNSSVKAEPATDEYLNSPDRLHNSGGNPPNLAIIEESPHHRLISYLVAQGFSKTEIARKTGYTIPWVSQITRQPWFRLRLVQELKEAGQDAVSATLKASVLDSVFTMVEIRDDPTTTKAVKLAACNSILDRYFGKPVQKNEIEDKRTPPSTPEISALDKEIQQIEEQLKSKSDEKNT
jgi:hypothetical protein